MREGEGRGERVMDVGKKGKREKERKVRGRGGKWREKLIWERKGK